ncbi:MBL fold metallo-hydrolase [Aspergillus clavatus NRRL 1]|uniref:Metallo-beta-lactamase domain protein, putative n=1 Tax=Aspergillus clavatus (strain ATCC 1007 / CBS 513.65 / DSM 816 / NCTC 3887 / NRRL 1 / QM 1276 / 107) TaxID=344612 RepID=A1CGM1_ASPCL|nr:metallo-beta-lactamase domain protein, putative [Aspergillus clavatus NRRL 1]EAW11101.1 metallo-beta-lactamase domain protein, putative [Aspergillus clavatus NRRL 1]
MKAIRPQITNNWHSTAGLLWAPSAAIRAPLRPLHQQATKKAAYATQNASSRLAPACTRWLTRPQVNSFQSISARHNPTARLGQALYSTTPAPGQPTIHDVFESKTGTWQYVVADPTTSTAVIIDPVLDYDPATQTITTASADALLALVKEKGYKVDGIFETHAHADHITAASYLQKRLTEEQGHRPPIGIGKRIGQVQKLFGQRYGVPAEEYEGVFDKLFEDDEAFNIGQLAAKAIHLPGHTPDHLGYQIGDNIFCGDLIFHADIGSARCDFPGGSANNLYQSGRRILRLPDHVKIWTGHDYPPEGRPDPVSSLSVQEHKQQNKHLKDGVSEEEFVALRKERDSSLAEPRLLHQSLQMNIRAGRLPKPTEAGQRLLHLPLKLKGLTW